MQVVKHLSVRLLAQKSAVGVHAVAGEKGYALLGDVVLDVG